MIARQDEERESEGGAGYGGGFLGFSGTSSCSAKRTVMAILPGMPVSGGTVAGAAAGSANDALGGGSGGGGAGSDEGALCPDKARAAIAACLRGVDFRQAAATTATAAGPGAAGSSAVGAAGVGAVPADNPGAGGVGAAEAAGAAGVCALEKGPRSEPVPAPLVGDSASAENAGRGSFALEDDRLTSSG